MPVAVRADQQMTKLNGFVTDKRNAVGQISASLSEVDHLSVVVAVVLVAGWPSQVHVFNRD